jgi:hypothetical protein
MAKQIFLREYPVKEEPRIFRAKPRDYKEEFISDYKTEVLNFFQYLGLNTLRRSINGNEYIEGSFKDIDNRTVRLRFFIHKGPYRNVMIEGDDNIYDIRNFKRLYRESPYIEDTIDRKLSF